MELIKTFTVIIVAVFVLSILKQEKSSILLPATALFCIVIFKYIITRISAQIQFIPDQFDNTSLSEYSRPLLKVLGVSLFTETTSDICRQAGENAFASKVELVGKAEMIILCFPLIEKMLEIIKSLILL